MLPAVQTRDQTRAATAPGIATGDGMWDNGWADAGDAAAATGAGPECSDNENEEWRFAAGRLTARGGNDPEEDRSAQRT